MNKLELLENERIDDLCINNLKIIQNKDYFCFGMDSILLANFVKSDNHKNNILDLCSGSGVIPILLSAKVKSSNIYAVELQSEMFDLLVKNIKLNNLDKKIFPIMADINCIDNSTFNFELNKKFDIITVNPPYKQLNSGCANSNKVKYIARHEEKCTLEDVFRVASKLLKSNGKLYMVHKPQRLTDLLSVARKYNLEAKKLRLVLPKLGLNPSIVLLEYSKNGGNELSILPPIIEYNEDGTYTDEILKIYGMEGMLNDKKIL